MFVAEPIVLHSQREDGRHWLTTMDVPPLQVWPVAPNHCRAGHFLARLLAAKLGSIDEDALVPTEVTLTAADVQAVTDFADRYPELADAPGRATIRLVMMAAPADSDVDDPGEAVTFLTPQPPTGWSGSYDAWIAATCRALGADIPDASHDGYEAAMATASAHLQQRLPALRGRFLAGLDDLNLGFKVGLATRDGEGKEYVWVSVQEWCDPARPVCRMESEPRDCRGYKAGRRYTFAAGELVDHAIGSEAAGVVECGSTQRLAEEYGLVIG